MNSVCPLGFLRDKGNVRWVNYNYYDTPALQAAATPFILQTLPQQIALGCEVDRVVIMGKKNGAYFRKINDAHGFFREVIEVPHPRFVAQYRRRFMDDYVEEYIRALEG